MKLFLASFAPNANETLGNAFLDMLPKPVKENKLNILSMDTTSEFHVRYLGIVKEWYKSKGFKDENIKIYNLIKDNIPSFRDLDVLHMWGGKTYHYLKRVKEPKLMQEIRDFIEHDGVYVGTSAGSHLMCPDLDPNLCGDVNDINLVDLEAFGYFMNYLVVHWDSMNSHLRTKQIQYMWKSGKHAIPLTDHQAVQVINKEWKIISPDTI